MFVVGGLEVGDGAGSMWLVLVSESKVVEGLGAGWDQSVPPGVRLRVVSESKVVEGLGAGCAHSVPPGVRLRLVLSELVVSKWEGEGVGVDSARSDMVDSILL